MHKQKQLRDCNGAPRTTASRPSRARCSFSILFIAAALLFALSHVSSVQASSCPLADLTGDGTVGGEDLLILLAHWGECPKGEPCPDLTGDGAVDGEDLLFLLGLWGCTVPEPTGACCFFTNCQDLTADECSKQYGFYAGDDTECAGEPVCPMDLACAGHCGEQSPVGCWCDENCFIFGDCCDTICQSCSHFDGCTG